MSRRRSSSRPSEETPFEVFISIFRRLSARSTNYFWCTNAKSEEDFGVHCLLDIKHEQMQKILETFNFVGSNGSVVNSGSAKLCSLVGPDYCQSSKHKIIKSNDGNGSESTATDQRYFIGIGILKGGIKKVAEQFEQERLIMSPQPTRLLREERAMLEIVLAYCNAGDYIAALPPSKQSPVPPPSKQSKVPPPSKQSKVPPPSKQSKVLPPSKQSPAQLLDVTLILDIGHIFREGTEMNRHERRRLQRTIKCYLSGVLSATLAAAQEAIEASSAPATVESEDDTNTTEDEVDMQACVAEFVSKHFGRKNRTLEHKSNNGRDTTLVARPFAKDVKSFIDEAKRSKWIQQMLPTDVYIRGMCVFLFQWRQDIYKDVTKTFGVNVFTTVPFENTMAMSGEIGLRSGQLRDLRSLLKTQGVLLQMPDKELDKLNREVGNIDDNDPICHVEDYQHVGGNLESCNYCTIPLVKEICLEVQKYFQTSGEIRNLDYDHLGSPGILVLFGGDHGGGQFRFHAKIHLSSPQERKERGDLSHGCPLTPMCNLECAKDTHGLLSSTVMKTLSADIGKVITSSCYVLFNSSKGTDHCKAYLLPIDTDKVEPSTDGKSFKYTRISTSNDFTVVPMSEELWGPGARATKVVSQFHDLYIGDLAFFATTLGMPGASSGRCLSCNETSANFNVACKENAFSIDEILASLQMLKDKWASGLKTKNIRGVSCEMLLPISDISKILCPTLHCPMGLIDKFLESFLGWAHRQVIEMNDDEETIRDMYDMAKEHLAIARQGKILVSHPSTTPRYRCQSPNTPKNGALRR
jgi:hypothetical protein